MGPLVPLWDTEELLTKGGEEPTGQTLPARGMAEDSSQGLHSRDPGKPNYFVYTTLSKRQNHSDGEQISGC